MSRCEDYPCCGHTDRDPCPGQAVIDEPWYCDECGIYHMHPEDSDYIRDIHFPDEPDEEDEPVYNDTEPYDEGYYYSGTGEWSEDSSYEDYLNR
jgi:ssDNA-binding Zn-finger/Zn-ribbon topoisomerase 1